MNDLLLEQLKEANDICQQAEAHLKNCVPIEKKLNLVQKIFTSYTNTKFVYGIYAIQIALFVIGLILWIATRNSGLFLVALYILPLVFLIYIGQIIDKKLRKQIEEIHEQARNILYQNQEKLAFLHSDYWYAICTDYLLKMVMTGRADTLNKALDMYDTQLHRWKLEETGAKILEEQERQTRQLNQIKINSAIAASASVANLFK